MTNPLIPAYETKVDLAGTLEVPTAFTHADSDVSSDLHYLQLQRGPTLAVEQTNLRVLSNTGQLVVRSSGNKYDLQTSPIGIDTLVAPHRCEIRLTNPLPQRPKNILWESQAWIDDWAQPPRSGRRLPGTGEHQLQRVGTACLYRACVHQ